MTTRAAAPPVATAFARGPFLAGGVVILEEEEAHHMRVRRVPDGAAIRLVDGRGGVATARLAFDRQVVAARVVATTTVGALPTTELLVAAGDRDRLLGIVEKATELGATRIVPLVTERSVQAATRFQASHVEKAMQRARDALKQCGGVWMPAVTSPLTLGEVLRAPAGNALRLVADREGGLLPLFREGDAVQWAVGPEGGFTETEAVAIRGAGFRAVALGRATLRFDTAAVAALALTAAARMGVE